MPNSIFRKTLLSTVAAGAIGLAAAGSAHAAGFALNEGSADWMANAFAGDAAKAYDASTAWSNPAGMTRLVTSEFDASVNGIFPSMKYSNGTSQTQGADGSNLISAAATAGIYGVWSVTPDFKLGFAADSPFGQRVANPGDFVGRYQSLVSSITDMQFLFSGAYRINPQFSIGGGPVLDAFSSRLTQAINPAPLAYSVGGAPAAAGAGILDAQYGDPVGDLHGSDTALAFNIGAMFEATDDLRFGIDYRSRIQHNITGTQSIYVPAGYASNTVFSLLGPELASGLSASTSSAKTSIILPDSVTVSGYWQANQQLAVMASFGWTDWSLLQSIVVTPSSPAAQGQTIPENWRNTWTASVGTNYAVTPALLLQGGLGFDQSPVTDSNRTSRIPDSDRILLGIGAQYEVLPGLTLQAAYLHVFFASAPISASGTGYQFSGSYSDSANTVSLGMKYRF